MRTIVNVSLVADGAGNEVFSNPVTTVVRDKQPCFIPYCYCCCGRCVGCDCCVGCGCCRECRGGFCGDRKNFRGCGGCGRRDACGHWCVPCDCACCGCRGACCGTVFVILQD